jgi:hypothetical protein
MSKITMLEFIQSVDRPHKEPIFAHKTTTCHHVIERMNIESMETERKKRERRRKRERREKEEEEEGEDRKLVLIS